MAEQDDENKGSEPARQRIRFEASAFLLGQLTELAKMLGTNVGAAARMACFEGSAVLLARHQVRAPGGAPAEPARSPGGAPMNESVLVANTDKNSWGDRGEPAGSPPGPLAGVPGHPADEKDANGHTAYDVRTDVLCPKHAAHGFLVLRFNEKKRLWFAGCATYAESRCKGNWSPAKSNRAKARERDEVEAQRKSEERERFAPKPAPATKFPNVRRYAAPSEPTPVGEIDATQLLGKTGS